jgi:uncharacterized protein YciI
MTSVPRHHLPEAALASLSEDELRARVARAQMYVLESRAVDGAPQPTEAQTFAHLAYLHKLENDGRLYASGIVDAGGGQTAYELAIVVAGSAEEAEGYAASEPLQQAGIVGITVTAHIINEGVACYFARELSSRAQQSSASFDPDVSSVGLSYDELQARAQGARMHIIRLKPGDKPRPTSDTTTGRDHFLWLRGNEMRARLMSCGPFEIAHPPGIWGGGLAVVAADEHEAEEMRAAEPSGQIGYRTLTVEPWVVDYGVAAPIAKALETLGNFPA